MRDPWGSEPKPLKVEEGERFHIVHVQGFGVVLVGRTPDGDWSAILVQPDAQGRFGKRSNQIAREVRVTDAGLEIELLPNPSGEDRLVVHLYEEAS
jgi:hypothetical protein